MRARLVCAAAAAALTLPTNTFAHAVAERVEYKGWRDCYRLSNPLVSVVIVPAIGGRVMEYSLLGKNVIWQNTRELGVVRPGDVGKRWHNYGGHKAWNAPQERWRTPDNDNFYDYAPASARVLPGTEDAAAVEITCAPIPHLGFQFVRKVWLSSSSSHVRVTETMRNISDRDIEWSVWSVTQVPAPCRIVFPVSGRSRFPEGYRVMWPEDGRSRQTRRVDGAAVVTYANLTEKIGADSPDGWMAYFRDSLAYVKRWTTEPGAAYPDGGCSLAVFTGDASMGSYAEMEVMSPITRLGPGDEVSLVEDWYLTDLGEAAGESDVGVLLDKLRGRGMLPRRTTPQTAGCSR